MLEESEVGIPGLDPYTYNCRLPPTTSAELVQGSFGDRGDDDKHNDRGDNHDDRAVNEDRDQHGDRGDDDYGNYMLLVCNI